MRPRQRINQIGLLPILVLICALLLSGCGGENTAERDAAFAGSPLSGYKTVMGERYTPVLAPGVLVRVTQNNDETQTYHVVGVSSDLAKEDFARALQENVRTLILCDSSIERVRYQSTNGNWSKGSTETVTIRYYQVDHAAQTLIPYAGRDSVTNELPKVSQNTPHYTVSDNQILSAVKDRIASGTAPCNASDYFRISKAGELYGTTPGYTNVTRIVIPDTVRHIEVFKFQGVPEKANAWTHLTAEIYVPPTVEEIDDGAFQYMNKNIGLVVEPGSCAERYAVEHEMSYRFADGETIFGGDD